MTSIPISLDSSSGTFITFLQYNKEEKKLWAGDITGNLLEYDFLNQRTKKLQNFGTALVDFTKKDTISYATAIGILNPSEQQKLTNIVAKINTDRSSNSSLYPNSSGLTGQSSDIGHALYSMKRWGNDILSEIKKY